MIASSRRPTRYRRKPTLSPLVNKALWLRFVRRFARSLLGRSKHTGRLPAARHTDRRRLLFLQLAIIACVVLLSPPPRASDGEGSGFKSEATLAVFTPHRRLSQGPRSFCARSGWRESGKKQTAKLLRFVSRYFWASFARLLTQTLALFFFCFFLTKTMGVLHLVGGKAQIQSQLKDGQMNR